MVTLVIGMTAPMTVTMDVEVATTMMTSHIPHQQQTVNSYQH